MKQFFIVLILYFTFFPLHAGPYYNRSTIKDGFNQFEKLPINEQIEILKEMKYIIQPEVLEFLAKSYDEETKKKYLINLLKTYDLDERQAFVNETLDKDLSYKRLFQNLTEKQFENVGCNANPQYISTLSIIDFLNCFHLQSFFQPSLKNSLIHRGHYNMFNSFDQFGLWIEPFGHFTSFNLDSRYKCPSELKPYYFQLNTIGINTGGEYTVTPSLVLSIGLAYSHSSIYWKPIAYGSLNSVYVGPSLSYLFTHGYCSFFVFGTINFYDINRKTQLFPNVLTEKKSIHSKWITWDLAGRFEGGLSFPLKLGFYLYPLMQFDYVNIFIQKGTETLYKKGNLTVASLHESFFESTIALKITKEVFKESVGFIIPHTTIGWVNYIPMQQSFYTYQMPGCVKKFKEKNALNSWSQCMIGIGISFLHKRGIFLLFSYEFFTGSNCQTHFGKAKIAWTW